MKICWDNLENVKYNPKTEIFRKYNTPTSKKSRAYRYQEACIVCGEPYLIELISIKRQIKRNRPQISPTCCQSCAVLGNKNPFYKGGVKDKNLPLYDTYAHQLTPVEEVRPIIQDGLKLLQVKCYNSNCREWFVPKTKQVALRISTINGHRGTKRDNFYCSDECKLSCNVFRQLSWPKNFKKPHVIFKWATNQELRIWSKEILFRADSICEICGQKAEQAHHILPKILYPEYSLDPDNGIALCLNCHQQRGHTGDCSSTSLHNKNTC